MRVVGSLVVTGLAAAYIVWKIDFVKTGHILGHARVGFFLAALAIVMATVWPMAWRWQQLLRAKGIEDNLGWLTRAYFVAYAAGQRYPREDLPVLFRRRAH